MSINLDDLSTPSGLAYDPLADDLIVGNISRGPFLSVYRLGDPTAIRQIGSGISADFLGIGNIGRTEYLLAPDSDGNQVSFFTHDKKLAGTLTAGDAPHGVVVKPLGVP